MWLETEHFAFDGNCNFPAVKAQIYADSAARSVKEEFHICTLHSKCPTICPLNCSLPICVQDDENVAVQLVEHRRHPASEPQQSFHCFMDVWRGRRQFEEM